jgi:hypothetical protein
MNTKKLASFFDPKTASILQIKNKGPAALSFIFLKSGLALFVLEAGPLTFCFQAGSMPFFGSRPPLGFCFWNQPPVLRHLESGLNGFF